MLNPEQHKKYCDFYDGARNNGVLDGKTSTLLGLASAMSVGCSP